ncbi:hypothetical protein [Clostridium intestinale]|uniref:Uncharacterized protein n=1 Tax=Clostridium intestinale DSM 6191 TaxID=1121320 RepID=A0A1M6AKP3_9CLOT|nr:hypothetical protein [Clostridium intestinale]SHI36987.1 hypothetical protein SAMN02745941_03689 [Clostridium intestinale DSM 6191]
MDKKEYNKSLCAFIDILGYKDLIDKAEESSEPLIIINKIEEIIEVCIKEYLDSKNTEDVNKYSYEIFSDSIIITTQIEHDETSEGYEEYLYKEMYILCLIVAGIQVQSINYNIIFRGAISIGNHYRSKNLMFSKALVNAYKSESNKAIYPRIIIDTCYCNDKDLKSEKLLNSLIRSGLIFKDKDIYFVDYIGRINSLRYFGDFSERNLKKHKTFIENNMKDYYNQSEVLKKYVWLASYYNYKLRIDDKDLEINLDGYQKVELEEQIRFTSVFIVESDEGKRIIDPSKISPGTTIIL